ncbi:MAG: hypothetical protein J6T43_09105 [Prevotella sp.]|nr:hypothetical protein [Prevotella sp.]
MNERRGGAVKPSHIGEGLVRVDVSFASFLCAKEKEERICFFDQRKRLAESAITQKIANKFLFLFPLNRNFGFAELTHVRKNSN